MASKFFDKLPNWKRKKKDKTTQNETAKDLKSEVSDFDAFNEWLNNKNKDGLLITEDPKEILNEWITHKNNLENSDKPQVMPPNSIVTVSGEDSYSEAPKTITAEQWVAAEILRKSKYGMPGSGGTWFNDYKQYTNFLVEESPSKSTSVSQEKDAFELMKDVLKNPGKFSKKTNYADKKEAGGGTFEKDCAVYVSRFNETKTEKDYVHMMEYLQYPGYWPRLSDISHVKYEGDKLDIIYNAPESELEPSNTYGSNEPGYRIQQPRRKNSRSTNTVVTESKGGHVYIYPSIPKTVTKSFRISTGEKGFNTSS